MNGETMKHIEKHTTTLDIGRTNSENKNISLNQTSKTHWTHMNIMLDSTGITKKHYEPHDKQTQLTTHQHEHNMTIMENNKKGHDNTC